MDAPQPHQGSGFPPEGRVVVPRSTARWRRRIYFLLPIACGVLGILWIARAEAGHFSSAQSAGKQATSRVNSISGVFSPVHPSIGEALDDFFDYYPTPVQPIAFNHSIHMAKGMKCTACHSGVTRGPDAGIPSIKFCMACHQVIATTNSQIKKLTAYAAKGQDVPWQRVYWFYPTAHVRFWHAPHIRAGVDCSVCHGDMSLRTVAVREKNITMQFCLGCHRAKGVSVDCATCHY